MDVLHNDRDVYKRQVLMKAEALHLALKPRLAMIYSQYRSMVKS